MRILMICVFPPIQVAEADHAVHLCEHLADYGAEVEVIAQKGCILPSHPQIRIYPVMRKWSWVELPTLMRFAARSSPDAVILIYHGYIYGYHPMITFAPTWWGKLRSRAPFVTLFEDVYGSRVGTTSLPSRAIRKGLARWFGPQDVDYEYGTLLRDSDRLIVVSEGVRSALSERFPGVNRKSVVIPSPSIMRLSSEENGCARRVKRAALGLRDEEFLIAYFGRIYRDKGVETLLKAFQLVSCPNSRQVRLIVIGGDLGQPAYSHRLHALSNELGIDDRVIWTGEYAWDSEEASRCLRAADICVLPFDKGISLYNSSLAGACAHGLPIITTAGALTEPVFAHEENAFLCPPRSPETLARAIQTLMAQPQLRQRLARGAGVLAREWFSWERAIKRTMGALTGASTGCQPV